jgi:Polyketide cyclase / dehydrase and lipid transport
MTPIILALAFIALILIIVVAGQPNDFVVSRQIRIAAPREQVFPHVNELRNWEAWNPWGTLDPNCQMTYSGPPAGVGASYAWSGNNKIGAGSNTITDSRPYELVRFRLEFLKPMVATNTAEFTFQDENGQTILTWTMSGSRNLPGKLFGLVLNCDKMCGDQFEKGLASIKSLAEGAPRSTPAREKAANLVAEHPQSA